MGRGKSIGALVLIAWPPQAKRLAEAALRRNRWFELRDAIGGQSAPTPLYTGAAAATGLRRAELTRVKSPISTQPEWYPCYRRQGAQVRDVMLSPELLAALRQYWRGLKHKPQTWLFPSGRSHNRTKIPMSDKIVWYACEQAAKRAGIDKSIHPTLAEKRGHRKLHPALLVWVVSFQNVTPTISADSRAPRFSSDSLAAGLHVIVLNRT